MYQFALESLLRQCASPWFTTLFWIGLHLIWVKESSCWGPVHIVKPDPIVEGYSVYDGAMDAHIVLMND